MRELNHHVVALLIAIVVIGGTVAIHEFVPQDSAPVPVAETPKLVVPHVVYFWVCNAIVGALIMDEPPIWSDVQDGMPPDAVFSMMLAAEATDRYVDIKYWHPGCFTLQPNPAEKT